ncbi:MAG: hypothetical protein AAGJ86_08900 [Pseudomonadota bacterium]
MQPDQTHYIVVRPERGKRCTYRDLVVFEVPEAEAGVVMQERTLSRLNQHGTLERGMKVIGEFTEKGREDACNGRLMAAAPFDDGLYPRHCTYESKPLLPLREID